LADRIWALIELSICRLKAASALLVLRTILKLLVLHVEPDSVKIDLVRSGTDILPFPLGPCAALIPSHLSRSNFAVATIW